VLKLPPPPMPHVLSVCPSRSSSFGRPNSKSQEQIQISHKKSEILTVLWDFTSCILVEVYRRFGGSYSLFRIEGGSYPAYLLRHITFSLLSLILLLSRLHPLRDVGKFVPDYTASRPRKEYSSSYNVSDFCLSSTSSFLRPCFLVSAYKDVLSGVNVRSVNYEMASNCTTI
jgi:hypothetical protein